uniref:Uncharacterized protein n=1 Tax=Rhizophora mucronata TaxID=61149 RepID=A0A2P2NXW2_RHIMU
MIFFHSFNWETFCQIALKNVEYLCLSQLS